MPSLAKTVDDKTAVFRLASHETSVSTSPERGILMMKHCCLMGLLALLIAPVCSSVRATPPADCLPYEPRSVQLTGRIAWRVFPGPPNYESIRNGDTPEEAWILHLAKPICVRADKKDEDNVAEDNVTDLQLVLRGNQFRQLRGLLRKGPVTLTGTLFHSFTGHHHTAVLMDVTGMKAR
jgi:hypothetical protein